MHNPKVDFERNVYCLLGLPFDAVDMGTAAGKLRAFASEKKRCVMTTPNLNILVGTLSDPEFRDSVIRGNLNVVDGMPLIWIAHMLRIPLSERVAGSALFDRLWKSDISSGRTLSVFFFGGPEGVAERACQTINSSEGPLACVGSMSPGFGSIEDMSGEEVLSRINESNADFLIISLGARKAHKWIEHNLNVLEVPLMSHLGAVVNFVAGTLVRAPAWMQKVGLEWVWRIKEEPSLWRRYVKDGLALIRLLVSRVIPYAIWLRTVGRTSPERAGAVEFVSADTGSVVSVFIKGDIPESMPDSVRFAFQKAAEDRQSVVVDLSAAGVLSPSFFGHLLLLYAAVRSYGAKFEIRGANNTHRRLFYWNAVEYLLSPSQLG